MTDRPVLIDLDDEQPSPADAPPVADIVPQGQAMQTVATLAARPRSRLWAWLWRSLGAVLTFLIGVALWTFVEGMIARSPLLGWAAILLIGVFLILCLAVLIGELSALNRLARVDQAATRSGRGSGRGRPDSCPRLRREAGRVLQGPRGHRLGPRAA